MDDFNRSLKNNMTPPNICGLSLIYGLLAPWPHLCAELDKNVFFLEFTNCGNFFVKQNVQKVSERMKSWCFCDIWAVQNFRILRITTYGRKLTEWENTANGSAYTQLGPIVPWLSELKDFKINQELSEHI